jgi:hypothetical protein
VTAADGTNAGAIWDTEDEQLSAAASRLIERNRGRGVLRAEPAVAEDGGRESSYS